MPSFGNMLEVVDLLQLQAIDVQESHCVAVRNRNSNCKKCADACIADAISVSRNEFDMDNAACVNCGCCVAVCPTNALHAVEPSAESVEDAARKAANAESGLVVIACARKAAKREGDPEKYAEVPCLGHISEDQLLSLAAKGFDDIALVDGDCPTCKYGAASPHIDATVETAAKLLDACNAQAIVTRSSDFPPEVVDREAASLRGKDRRGIMRQTGSYVKTVAGNVAQKTIDEKLGRKDEPVTLRDRLGAGKSGRVPTFEPAQNYKMLECMEKLAAPEGQGTCFDENGIINTRRFGNVYVDATKCSGCGMCVMFCPTAALKFAEFDDPENPDNRYLEFQAADCTQCMLCKDVCLRYCLEVDSKVGVNELFDFEPRLIEIPRPKNTGSVLDFKKRR